MSENQYKDLYKFSKSIGISPDRLVKAFEIEKEFHYKILNEPSSEERKKLYSEVYPKVHKIYGKTETDITKLPNPKEYIAHLFKRELENKSVLDVGCGEGFFLLAVLNNLETQNLCGIDVSIPQNSLSHKEITFIETNIIDFKLEEKFDVIIADQVLEHIAPADLQSFFTSIKNALNTNGTLILLLPNSLFGPSDVTRIKDCSQSGKIKAEGTHLFETTYTDLLPLLEEYGFNNFSTVCQIPKLKKWMSNFRFNANIMKYIEKNKFLMESIYKIRYRGLPLLKFDIVIVCRLN